MPPAADHGWLEVRVAARVLDQVVTAHEAFGTKRALEALLTRVSAQVTCQLIRAGKFLLTVGPGAWEWPFTCKTHKTHQVLKHHDITLTSNLLNSIKHGIFARFQTIIW